MGEESEGNDFAFLEDDILSLIGDRFDFQPCSDFVFSTSSNRMQRFEFLKELIRKSDLLQRRLEYVKEYFHEEDDIIDEILIQSRNPLIEEELTKELDKYMMISYSFEPKFSRYLQFWTGENDFEAWKSILERCASVDVSSYATLENISHLFGTTENVNIILHRLEELEEKERMQGQSIKDMLRYLTNQGLDVSKIRGFDFVQSFDAIARYQEFLDEKESMKITTLSPLKDFDLELFHSFQKQMESISSPDQKQDLVRLRTDIQDVLFRLEESLQRANEQKTYWQNQGIKFEHHGPIQAKDLRDWEETIAVQNKGIEEHLQLIEKWNRIIEIFPDHHKFSENFIGQIEKNSDFKEYIEMLDLRRKQTEIDGLKRIEKFEFHGIRMEEWKSRFIANSIVAMNDFELYEPLLNLAANYIEALIDIDVSFEGEQQRDDWLQKLRNDILDNELFQQIEEFIDWKTKRNNRHRLLLEKEAQSFDEETRIRLGKLSIAEFERAVTRTTSHSSKRKKSSQEQHRLYPYVEKSIQNLEHKGWNLANFPELSAENAHEIASILHDCQHRIDTFPQLRNRLLRLPWDRDIGLAIAISQRIQDPLELQKLYDEIPSFIQHLSRRDVEHEHFVLRLWAPKETVPTLLPMDKQNPKLKPVDSSTLDDAHEAILEAMEPEIVIPESEVINDLDVESHEENGSELSEPQQTVIHESEEGTVESDDELTSVTYEENSVLEKRAEHVEHSEVSSIHLQQNRDELINVIAQFCGALGLKKSQEAIFNGVEGVDYARRNLAKQVGLEPRDIRVDRMLRIALRCFPKSDDNDSTLVKKQGILSSFIRRLDGYHRWMRNRLEHRHSSSSGVFLQDARALGVALERIPGPGVRVPLESDTMQLPKEMEELGKLASELEHSLVLATAGGMAVAST